MIRLDRNKSDENGQEISPSPGWFQRAGAARDDAVRQGRQHEFLASIYSAREVRACLSAISSDKCAYCEYRLSRTDWDVDHYRPKARVYGRDDHSGYYWLAYEWDNLLPACKHCNQLRSDPPTLGNLGRTRGRGKGDKFPLADEQFRAFSPADQISNEEPLLINPALEDPSEHITFDPLGKPIKRTKKGRKSIKVYNLDTRQLNNERRRTILRMAELFRLSKRAKALPGGHQAQQILAKAESMIENKIADSADYAAAARAVVKDPTRFELR